MEEQHVFASPKGGAYLVNGRWVDANGEPCADPTAPTKKATPTPTPTPTPKEETK